VGRRLIASILAVALTVFPSVAFARRATAANPAVQLLVPQSTAYAALGHSCGYVQENTFITHFNTSSGYTKGYPDGDAYLQTRCGCGRFCSITYTAWVAVIWDFTAALVTSTVLAAPPSVNPTLSLFDSHGNQIYNQSNRAYLVLAAGFVPAPRVAGVSPASAPQGTTLTISGTGFTGATSVDFGKHAANFTINSDTSITAIAPAVRTGTVDVIITGPGGVSGKNQGDRFTFTLTPRIASLNPTSGTADGGTKVTIRGDNFTGATSVFFGSPATFKVVNSHTITAITPPGPDSGITVSVWVTSAYGTSNTASYMYTN
jgi:hypothetical protein